MLLNVPAILSPELIKVLAEMGHGDTILLSDGNYPGASAAKRSGAIFIRADGHGVPELLNAVLELIPLDRYTDTPAMVMGVDKRDKGMQIPIHDEYRGIIAQHDERGADAVGELERYAFYEKAAGAYCIVQTGESAIYANILLQKGVIQ